MIGAAPAWAVWLALGLWGVALSALGAAFVAARRLWRQFSPQLQPLLQMFGGFTGMGDGTSTASDSAYVVSEEPPGYRPFDHEQQP